MERSAESADLKMSSFSGYSYRNGRHVLPDFHGNRTPSPPGTEFARSPSSKDLGEKYPSPTKSPSPPASEILVPSATRPNPPPPDAFVIGIAGGSASGKTSVAEKILSMLHPNKRVAIVTQDSFYRNLTPEELPLAREFNWDCPEAFDWELQRDVLAALRHRKKVEVPVYDYVHNCRSETEHVTLWNVDVVIFEGILAFYRHPDPNLCLDSLIDLKVFVETDADTRLARRVFRDTQFRGRSIESVLTQYSKFVKPSYDTHIAPLKRRSDIIIPWGDYSDNVFYDDGSWKNKNYPALDMIVRDIQLKARPATTSVLT